MVNTQYTLAMKNNLILVLLFCASFTGQAENETTTVRWFEVEVIVFENLSSAGVHEEEWSLDVQRPDMAKSVYLKPLTNYPKKAETYPPILDIIQHPEADDALLLNYQQLPQDKWRMKGLYRRLKRSRNYHPIYHTAWMQSIVDDEKAQKVRINFNGRGFKVVKFYEQESDDIEEDIMQQEAIEYLPLLEGTLSFYKSRYYHLGVDLIYRKELGLDDDNEEQIPVKIQPFVLKEKRNRIRSKVVYYFDHPVFGVIMQVNRYAEIKKEI